MKTGTIALVLALALGVAGPASLAPTALAQTQDVAQQKGVMNKSTWKTSNVTGKKVTVGLKAQTSGRIEVTFTDKHGNTNKTDEGTPNPYGGCSDCKQVLVGEDWYRIKNNKVQWKNPATGHWVDMMTGGF